MARPSCELTESEDPLEAGLEIIARPPGKKPQIMTLLSGGEQALTAMSLIFAVFLTNPAPICVLDEVDAPLDDANVERFCNLLDEMNRTTETRFVVITHNPITMSRMNRLFGVHHGRARRLRSSSPSTSRPPSASAKRGNVRIVGIDHVQLAMPRGREDDARAFCRDILGMEEIPKPANLAARGGRLVRRRRPSRFTSGWRTISARRRRPTPRYLSRNLDAFRSRLSEGGHAPHDDEPLPGYRRFYVADPFGNRLEFIEPADATVAFEPNADQREAARALARLGGSQPHLKPILAGDRRIDNRCDVAREKSIPAFESCLILRSSRLARGAF